MRTTVAAVSAGGVLGALARYGLGAAVGSPGGWPLATFLINATGCLLIGALMAVVNARTTHRLLRPFLGVGVLGGYTTFSTYAVDARGLLAAGRTGAALLYVALTPVCALLAVYAGTVAMRMVLRR